jgi:hypothetical protein
MPRIVANSYTEKVTVTGAAIEPVPTVDGTPLYKIRFDLAGSRTTPRDVMVEYEIQDSGGAVLGGGSFLVRSDMIDPHSGSVTVLAGFTGIKVQPGQLVLARFVDDELAAKSPAKQFTDTCTTFCDHCSDKAEAVCVNGVSSLNCSCGDNARTCSYSCASRPPV